MVQALVADEIWVRYKLIYTPSKFSTVYIHIIDKRCA